MRHNKIRRQNSEDAGQFHFISGDQLASTSGQRHHLHQGGASLTPPSAGSATTGVGCSGVLAPLNYAHGKHILRDSHFRRAGSQPPLSTMSYSSSQPEFGQHHQQQLQPSGGLLQAHLAIAGGGSKQQQATVSTTNSSSSGVSSTTSSTLAANESLAAAGGHLRQHDGGGELNLQQPLVRPQLDGSPEAPAMGSSDQQQQQQRQQASKPLSRDKSNGRSWTSRIKHRNSGASQAKQAEAPDQQQQQGRQLSSVSRYRFRLADPDSFQINGKSRARQSASPPVNGGDAKLAGANTAARNHESSQGLDELKKRPIASTDGGPGRPVSPQVSNNNSKQQRPRVWSEDHGAQRSNLLLHRGAVNDHDGDEDGGAANSGEDSDLNDIYSTPNDSIQSVPNSQLLLLDANNHQRRASSSATNQASHPIVKSFSTNNFNDIIQRNQNQKQLQYQSSIDEHHEQRTKVMQSSSSSSASSKTTTNLQVNDNNSNGRGQQHQHLNTHNQSSASKSRSNNGSRFFISSSSSEDSNPPQNGSCGQLIKQQQQQQPNGQPPSLATLDHHQAHIPVQHGLHYHEPHMLLAAASRTSAPQQQPAATRPSSLGLAAPDLSAVGVPSGMTQASPTMHHQGLLTPSAVLLTADGPLTVNGNGHAAIAAISPMLAQPQAPIVTLGQNLNPTAFIVNHYSNQQAALVTPTANCQLVPAAGNNGTRTYKKSPSLFDMSNGNRNTGNATRFSSKYPSQQQQQNHRPMSSFVGPIGHSQRPLNSGLNIANPVHLLLSPQPQVPMMSQQPLQSRVPNSISLHDCKLLSGAACPPQAVPAAAAHQQLAHSVGDDNNDSMIDGGVDQVGDGSGQGRTRLSEYKLAQMLLKLGSNPAAKDQNGCTALMHAILSENLSAFKCLIEHGVDLNEINDQGLCALDLICGQPANEMQMEMFKLLIDNHVDFDRTRDSDGTRLLDRLIGYHEPAIPGQDKLPFIDCLLHNGARLGSSTWHAANGKHAIQLRLLRKLCQDGYFLYNKLSIEAAVYRFEYALKRIAELEQQLATDCCRPAFAAKSSERIDQETIRATQQVKYQTYLGLSRCERKRKFFKRALEFAHMSILIDSTSYEGYYSKAHILKDTGDINNAIIAIDQTDRLVDRSIEFIEGELSALQNQEESIVFDRCFNMHDPNRSSWIEANRSELINDLDYLKEAKKHVSRLRSEILDDKLRSSAN